MLRAWRIVKARHAEGALDGEGARIHGGRWNSPGVPVVYLAESRALALLEVLVHLGDEAALASYVLIEVRLLERGVQRVEASELPARWRASPPPPDLRRTGDAWARAGRALVLSIPSAIVPEERILLLNPAHRDAARVRRLDPVPVDIDGRLLGGARRAQR